MNRGHRPSAGTELQIGGSKIYLNQAKAQMQRSSMRVEQLMTRKLGSEGIRGSEVALSGISVAI